MTRAPHDRRWLVHWFFRIALVFKGLDGVLELVGGILAFTVSRSTISRMVVVLTQHELSEDPHDLVANALRHLAAHVTPDLQVFAAVYLLAHAVVKIGLVLALARSKLWAYPAAIAVFLAFAGYQLYRFAVGHAPAMLLLTVIDVGVIVVTWLEYRRVTALAAARG